MLSSALQILAFALALLGLFGATVATLLPNWKVSADQGPNIITAITQMQGLWMDCTWWSTGVFSCTLKYSVLALPAHVQTARTTMVLSCMMSTLGLCLAALGLKCTRWGGSHRAKGHTAIAAGGCFVAAGVLCLVPASWFTNVVITTFLDARVPESSKYEPGGAVYVAFVSAGFFLAAGVLFCLSCPGKRELGELELGTSYPLRPSKATQPKQQQQQQQPQLQHPRLSRQARQSQTDPEQVTREQQTQPPTPVEQSSSVPPPPPLPAPSSRDKADKLADNQHHADEPSPALTLPRTPLKLHTPSHSYATAPTPSPQVIDKMYEADRHSLQERELRRSYPERESRHSLQERELPYYSPSRSRPPPPPDVKTLYSLNDYV
ncbi:claudin-20-like [Engraulis encrasicolus]|uniref:claudin-20-like n=1 Tax=Engraulis encrasicolus TaxID=184585 RepID=UPI002FD1E398